MKAIRCLAGLLVGTACVVVAGADDPKRAVPEDTADLTSGHVAGEKKPLSVLLTEWLDSVEGGYFSSKHEVRPIEPGSNVHGIFATEFIAKGELLSKIPWQYIITDDEDPEASQHDADDPDLKCGTARNLAREMRQVQSLSAYITDPIKSSKYGPYIQYLLEMPRGQNPSEWSNRGREILNDILGGSRQKVPPLYATTWVEEDFIEDCNGDPRDDIAVKAAMLVVARSDDNLLIPVYDMYNHRNGRYYNTHMRVNKGVNYQITARRDIQVGEQIYNSYNMCDNCGGRKDGYGTPETFRDYGFVEDFPQRWNFEEFEILIDLDKLDSGDVRVIWNKGYPDEKDDVADTKLVLMKELQRLVKKRDTIWKAEFKDGKSSIPEKEWTDIWNYHQALVNALTYAYNDIVEESNKLPVGENSCSADGFCGINYFDKLEYEKDEVKYNIQTCENKEIMQFPDYFMIEGLKTHYQVLNFAFREEDGDICMDLEDTVQICSVYRPHYHEFSSHFAARFVDNVKRVVFVGGGDSMMLHEVLKYPSLEKVVGLELDQTVVRKSFKYFRTQPHFDNDKVEWWFGDATKSLLLLPEDYWGSFDLVIVDLSETVMAFSVTDELDVFDALALLLNPDGVMVKNEHYMETMSETFDYTLQVYLDKNPKICSQCMIFGSNNADFFHKPLVEHGVETLLLPPVEELKDEYQFFHDIRKNDALKQGKCNLDTNKESKKATHTKSAGLLHVLDAEGVAVTDKTEIENIILTAAAEEGWTNIQFSSMTSSDSSITTSEDQDRTIPLTLVFKEGYVAAQVYPLSKYVAVDVGVWGSFLQGDKLRNRIAKDLKAETSSFFRIVVGGMFGTSTWEEEKKTLGPQIVQQRNCELREEKTGGSVDVAGKNDILNEALSLVSSSQITAAVICGVKGVDECPSVDLVGAQKNVAKVIPVWTCPGLSNGEENSEFGEMASCEQSVVSTLMESVFEDGRAIGLIVLDETTPYSMGRVLHSILTVDESHREMLMVENDHLLMSLYSNTSSNNWRENMLERYRKVVLYDPIKLAVYNIDVGGPSMALSILAKSASVGFKSLKTLEENLARRLGTESYVEAIKITGGLFEFQEDFKPREYLQTDYPEEPGNEQWAEQKSFGRNTVVQFELNKEAGHTKMPDEEEFRSIIESTLKGYGPGFMHTTYLDVGDGVVITSYHKGGSIILTWDGREHCDLNIFLHNDAEWDMKELVNEFLRLSKSKVQMTLRDDFPRGIGRVMNFNEDMSYTGWKDLVDPDPYVDLD